MSPGRPLDIQITSRYRPLPLRAVIRRALAAAAVAQAVPAGASVGVLVCDDETMRGYNRRFAGRDAATDVLAFPTGEPLDLGDIILSLEHLERQAAEAGHSVEREAAVLVVHGFLHLLGYDHARKADERRMFGRTDLIVAGLGI